MLDNLLIFSLLCCHVYFSSSSVRYFSSSVLVEALEKHNYIVDILNSNFLNRTVSFHFSDTRINFIFFLFNTLRSTYKITKSFFSITCCPSIIALIQFFYETKSPVYIKLGVVLLVLSLQKVYMTVLHSVQNSNCYLVRHNKWIYFNCIWVIMSLSNL